MPPKEHDVNDAENKNKNSIKKVQPEFGWQMKVKRKVGRVICCMQLKGEIYSECEDHKMLPHVIDLDMMARIVRK